MSADAALETKSEVVQSDDNIRKEFAKKFGLYAAELGNTSFTIGENEDIHVTMDRTANGTTMHLTLAPGAGIYLDKGFSVGDEGNVSLTDSLFLANNWNPIRAIRRRLAGEDNDIDLWMNNTDLPTTMVARTSRNILALDLDKAGGSVQVTSGGWVAGAFSKAVERPRVSWTFRWLPWSNHFWSAGNSAFKQTISGARNFAFIDARGTVSISEVKRTDKKAEFINSSEYLVSSIDVKLRTKWRFSVSRLRNKARVWGMGLSTDAEQGYYVSTNNENHRKRAAAADVADSLKKIKKGGPKNPVFG